MNIRRERYRTRFGRFVQSYTVARLLQVMAMHGDPVTPRAVYGWMAGATVPRPRRALLLVQVSGGRISIGDIYRHSEQVNTHGGSNHGQHRTGTETGVAERTTDGPGRN